jgi:hypothetical protein
MRPKLTSRQTIAILIAAGLSFCNLSFRILIQYQFLKLVFEDKTPVFTRYPDGQKGMDFADVYI